MNLSLTPAATGHRDEGSFAAETSALVERARAGDERAFEAVHRRFEALVHGILLASAPRSEVDDLMQDVFLSAWRGLASLRTTEHVGAWLATIARNRARRRYARAKPVEELPDELPAKPARERAEGREILEVLRTLPESYRETLTLRLVENMTGPEIAERTGLTHGSVRVNLSRGMKLLREALELRGYA